MNTLNGYSKTTLTDNFVLTAAGGHLSVGNSGLIPLNNNTVNTNLNADLLDGKHASDFALKTDISLVNNGVLTILKNGVNIGTFSANQSNNSTINISVPEQGLGGSTDLTGSGTSGYLTKWNGNKSLTNGPLLGSSTSTYLRNDGEWSTPSDTKNTAGSSNSTSKLFIIGTISQSSAGVLSYSNNKAYVLNGIIYSNSNRCITSDSTTAIYSIKSVSSLPTTTDANTLYLII